jgi:hypothetical protein
MVSGLRLVLCHLVIHCARLVSLLLLPGSPASSAGFHQSLALIWAKHNSRYNGSKAQHDIYESSNEVSCNSGEQDACNYFMI